MGKNFLKLLLLSLIISLLINSLFVDAATKTSTHLNIFIYYREKEEDQD